jgi:RNA polymerase sigma-70 factor (ECF subfamily)
VAHADEAELIALAKTGNPEAFRRLVVPYLPSLLAYCQAICGNYHTAEDVVQHTALIAYRKLNYLFAEADFGTWLKSIARREALSARRQVKLSPALDECMEMAYEDPSPAAVAPERAALALCLQLLAGRAGQTVRAHYFDGRKLADIARDLNTTVNTLKQLLHRARATLRDCMQRRLRLGSP